MRFTRIKSNRQQTLGAKLLQVKNYFINLIDYKYCSEISLDTQKTAIFSWFGWVENENIWRESKSVGYYKLLSFSLFCLSLFQLSTFTEQVNIGWQKFTKSLDSRAKKTAVKYKFIKHKGTRRLYIPRLKLMGIGVECVMMVSPWRKLMSSLYF